MEIVTSRLSDWWSCTCTKTIKSWDSIGQEHVFLTFWVACRLPHLGDIDSHHLFLLINPFASDPMVDWQGSVQNRHMPSRWCRLRLSTVLSHAWLVLYRYTWTSWESCFWGLNFSFNFNFLFNTQNDFFEGQLNAYPKVGAFYCASSTTAKTAEISAKSTAKNISKLAKNIFHVHTAPPIWPPSKAAWPNRSYCSPFADRWESHKLLLLSWTPVPLWYPQDFYLGGMNRLFYGMPFYFVGRSRLIP